MGDNPNQATTIPFQPTLTLPRHLFAHVIEGTSHLYSSCHLSPTHLLPTGLTHPLSPSHYLQLPTVHTHHPTPSPHAPDQAHHSRPPFQLLCLVHAQHIQRTFRHTAAVTSVPIVPSSDPVPDKTAAMRVFGARNGESLRTSNVGPRT